MSNEVPLYICRHQRRLLDQLLHVVLAKVSLDLPIPMDFASRLLQLNLRLQIQVAMSRFVGRLQVL